MPSTDRKRLFLIDAMGYIFRAYFAPMDRLQTASGIPTKVPYLFATMMRRLLTNKDRLPDYVAVAFDVSAPTFRDKLFAAYKAQRPPMPDDLSIQIPFVRRYCEAMRLPILEYPGYEADDVIGTLARLASKKNLDVFIVTSDKDMLQLVTANVLVLNPTKADLLIDEKKVEELMGVPPSKVADVMALMGDSIDNIPGARDPNEKVAPGERRKPGIGEVGARQLIQQFGSAEETLKRASEVKRASYREALEKCGEFVTLSKKLATIPTDAPVALDLEAMKVGEPDTVALRELYSELGFTSLLRELAPLADAQQTDYAPIEPPTAFKEFLDAIPFKQETSAWLALDAQDSDAEGFGTRVLAVEVSTKLGQARIAANDVEDKTLAAMQDWLADAKHAKIVHDPKLFQLLAARADLRESGTAAAPKRTKKSGAVAPANSVAGIRHATMLYSYLLRPTTANHEFAEVVLRHLNRTLSGAPGERADFLMRVAPVLRAEVEAQGLLDLYEKIDLPLAAVLARMEAAGVRVDPVEMDRISATTLEEIGKLEKSIYGHAGVEFNINSPQQLAEILFDKLKLQPPRRSRAKARSTAADILEELAAVHELPKKIIEYRELAKLKSTYSDVLPRLIHPVSAACTRASRKLAPRRDALAPPIQICKIFPSARELGREIRAAFVAAPGCQLLSADYSQIELRILAHLSGDPVLVEAFRRGEDIHSRTAQEVFDVAPFAQTREHRRVAKVINFGVIYGLSAFGLAQQLGIDQKEAAHFIAKYFERYRGVKDFLERQIAETRRTGIHQNALRPHPSNP